jgi:CRISPR-associated endonuclease/helicase Cas3
MHVVLISACEKRALKRSRALLDSYALRAGERTWASAMTVEGLHELRAALKRVASRHTAVACYRNEGMRRMKLLWIVGSTHHFGPHGHFPAGTTRRRERVAVPAWVRQAALLADAAGQGHDVGKATIAFQRNLRDSSAPQKDSIRHEWVSLKVIQALRGGADWATAWRCLENQRDRESIPFGECGLNSALDVFDFLVVSHHGLFGPKTAKDGAINASNHVRQEPPFDPIQYQPQAALPEAAMAYLNKKVQRLGKIVLPEGVDAPLYWRALAIIARAGLIFADHYISSLSKPKDAELYANTKLDKATRQLDQPLDQHLSDVSGMAGQMTYRLATLRLPGLSEEAVERIMERTEHPLFAWQNHASAALENARRTTDRPALVLNLAGTGAGKTRMNAKCACALAQDHRIRFATALNLRTLTLQTGDAYREQLRIGRDELACVIGDRIAIQLHENTKQQDAFTDEDENPIDVEFEALGEEFFVPAWVEPFIKDKKRSLMRSVIGAPVLASTVDFLIAAGEPHRQGNHTLALLRLVDSDLILDEIDSYDPKAMVAVLRLVQMAGLFGRNVISSSATLGRPVATALYRTYRSGIAMRAALNGRAEGDFLCALIDDHLDPEVLVCKESSEFESHYDSRIKRLLAALHGQSFRIPKLVKIAAPNQHAWQEAIAQSVLQLHEDNAWPFAQTGKRVSFGLVRIANIRPAIETARFLADRFPNAHVACYHAQDFTIQRFLKEKRLDQLLTRKSGNGNSHIESDPDIRERVSRTDSPDVKFIVVATPVEEIGRDHDFDWAVIEPSSTQSIVQTAGRVNRHRRLTSTAPNIAILQYNFLKVKNFQKKDPSAIVFTRPGLETIDWPYNKGRGPHKHNHNLEHLIDWSQLQVLDAGLRFRNHPFALLDDENLTKMIEKPLKILCMEAKHRDWMVEATYADYPLRDKKDAQQTWRLNENDAFEVLVRRKTSNEWILRDELVKRKPAVANAWLAWTREDLVSAADKLRIQYKDAFSLTTHDIDVYENGFEWDEAFGASRLLNSPR